MKDPRVVEIEFLSYLEQASVNEIAPWDLEKRLGVSGKFFSDMVYGLFVDRCLEGMSPLSSPYPIDPGLEKWGDYARTQAVKKLLGHAGFAAYLNHRGRIRLWRLRDEVQKARTKEKFGILWSRQHWDSDVLIQLAMKDQTKPSAVLFMDLNNFKPVNDTYGHAIGDEVMQIYFQTVLKLVGAGGEVYGWGGDEVVVFLPETKQASADALVQAIKDAVATECSAQPVLAEHSHAISVACGTYVFSDRKLPAEIADIADKLMYQDKHKMKTAG